MKTLIVAYGLEGWFGGDPRPVVDLVAEADRIGIDGVGVGDHVVMGTDFSNYSYGFGGTFDPGTPFLEPVVLLSLLAARTERIRLTTSILLAPLRPAVLLAKQIATLDLMSNGRVDLALGTGWQKAEYDFSGAPWEGRYARLTETMEAMRRLWRDAPASFQGDHVSFAGAYSKPFPAQPGGPPMLLGVNGSAANIERLARHADGWFPSGLSLDEVLAILPKIHGRMRELGRDPAKFRLRAHVPVVRRQDGKPDLDATLAQLPVLAARGIDELNFNPLILCQGPEDFGPVMRKIVAAREAL